MTDDIARQLRRIQSSNYYRSNTLRINLTDEGGLTLSPMIGDTTREFSSLEQAESYIGSFGLTYHTRVQPSRGYLGGSSATQNIARQFERGVSLSTGDVSPGGWVEEQHFRFDDPSQLESFRQIYNPEEGKYVGFPNIDENKATLLRFFDPSGRELEYGEAAETVFQTRGWQQNIPEPGGKVGKRLKGLLTERMFELEQDQPLRVGVVDLQSQLDMDEYIRHARPQVEADVRAQYGLSDDFDSPGFRGLVESNLDAKLQEARERAVDGFSEISERAAQRTRDFMRSQESNINAELRNIDQQLENAAPGQYQELLRERKDLQNSADLLRRRAGEMDEFIQGKTGMFNIRALGLELENIHGVDISHLWEEDERMRGVFEVKGNAVMADNPLMHQYNVDIITDVSNITRQGGLTKGSAGRLTWNPFTSPDAPVENTRWDIQTASSYPEFFDRATVDQMSEQVRADISDMARRINEGEVPDELLGMLRSQADSPDPMTAQEAQQALGYVERGGSLADDPSLARRVLRTYHGEDVNLQRAVGETLQRKGLGGEPLYQMPVPDTIRGEIAPRIQMQHAVPANELPNPGELRYSPTKTAWIMHESDAGLYHYAWGGFDFDDMINNMVRYNPDANTLEDAIQGLAYRQPNVRGEWARLRINPEDFSVQHSLKKRGADQRFQGMYQALKRSRERLEQAQTVAEQNEYAMRVRRAETSIRRLLSENLNHVPQNVDEIPMRFGERISTGEHTYRYQGEPFAEYVRQSEPDPEWGAIRPWEMSADQRSAQAKRTMDVLQRFVGGEDQLVGMYSNARMFMDHWVANQQTVLRNSGAREHIARILYEHEDVIDAYAQGFAQQPTSQQIQDTSQEMIKSVYRAAAYLRGQGFDPQYEVGIDPTLRRWKGGFEEAARAGIEEGIQDLGGQGRFVTDPDGTVRSITPDDLELASDADKATIHNLYYGSRETHQFAQAVEDSFGYPSWLDDVPGLESQRATEDARRLLDSARGADEVYRSQLGDLEESGLRRMEAMRMSQTGFMEDVVDLFEDGQAGERTNRAILRARQLIEQENMPTSFADRFEQRLRATGAIDPESQAVSLSEQANLYGRVQAGLADPESLRNLETINASDVYHSIGSTTRGGPVVDETIDRILFQHAGNRTPSRRALEDLTTGIDVASRRGDINLFGAEVPDEVRQLFQGDTSKAHVIPGKKLRGPLDPDLPIYVPERNLETGQEYSVRRLGEMINQSLNQFESREQQTAVDRHIADALSGYYESLRQWGRTPGAAPYEAMPEEVRSTLQRHPEGSDIFPASDHGRQAASRAMGDATNATDVVSDGRYRRMSGDYLKEMASINIGRTTLGRLGIGAAAVAAGLVLYRQGNRDPDHTRQDMQGPNTLSRDPAPYSSLDRYLAANSRPAYTPSEQPRDPLKEPGIVYNVEVSPDDFTSEDFVRALTEVMNSRVSIEEQPQSRMGARFAERDFPMEEVLRNY